MGARGTRRSHARRPTGGRPKPTGGRRKARPGAAKGGQHPRPTEGEAETDGRSEGERSEGRTKREGTHPAEDHAAEPRRSAAKEGKRRQPEAKRRDLAYSAADVLDFVNLG